MYDNEEEREVLEKDKMAHPQCSYSTSISSSFTSINGQSKAETLKRIFRNCPRQAPVEIYNNKESNQGSGSDITVPHSMQPEEFGNVLGEFQRMFDMFGSVMKDPFGGSGFPDFGLPSGFPSGFPSFERGGIWGDESEEPSMPQRSEPPAKGKEYAYPPPHKFPRGSYPGGQHSRGDNSDVGEV